MHSVSVYSGGPERVCLGMHLSGGLLLLDIFPIPFVISEGGTAEVYRLSYPLFSVNSSDAQVCILKVLLTHGTGEMATR